MFNQLPKTRVNKYCMCFALSLVLITISPHEIVADEFSIGSKQSGVLALDTPGDVEVVLPEGEWEVVINTDFRNNENAPHTFLGLIQTENQRVTQFIRILTFTEVGSGNGYVASKLCKRKNLHHKKVYANYEGGEQDCYVLNHYVPNYQSAKYKHFNAVGDLLIARNIEWGHHLPTGAFTFADKYELFKVFYQVDPVKYGFQDYEKTSWANSPWHPDNVRNDPDKKRFIEALQNWIEEAYPIVKQGWKNNLQANVKLPEFRFSLSSDSLKQTDKPAASQPSATAIPKIEKSKSLESKLEQVKKLLERGLITKSEAAEKRKAILQGL